VVAARGVVWWWQTRPMEAGRVRLHLEGGENVMGRRCLLLCPPVGRYAVEPCSAVSPHLSNLEPPLPSLHFIHPEGGGSPLCSEGIQVECGVW